MQTSPEKASIHTAEMTAIKKKKKTRWVIYTDLQSSMLAVKNHRKPSNIKSDI